MGKLYDINGKGIYNIPILEFKNGEVTQSGSIIKDIKVTYKNNDIFLCPRKLSDSPIATCEQKNNIWYIYKFPRKFSDTNIGHLENKKIYKPTNAFKAQIGYYEGTDMIGAVLLHTIISSSIIKKHKTLNH